MGPCAGLLRASGVQGRQWYQPLSEARFGFVAWLRGEFQAADSHLRAVQADHTATDQQLGAVWLPTDPIAATYFYLALTRFVLGDQTGAEAALAQAAHRTGQLGFPQGPFSLTYTRFVEPGSAPMPVN